jgi:hypothetical protein
MSIVNHYENVHYLIFMNILERTQNDMYTDMV